MNYKLDYFYGKEADQFTFFRIPKLLFTDSRFSKVSIEAKVLYGLLLDRMSLSVKNGWVDEENRVYIYFKVSDAMECMDISGQVTSATYSLYDNMKTNTNIPDSATMSVNASYFNAAQKKIQLRDTFTVTCTAYYMVKRQQHSITDAQSLARISLTEL